MMIILILFLTTIKWSAAVSKCNIEIVESIPESLTYESTSYIARPVWGAWKDLIQNSKKYVRINSLYWSLLGNDSDVYDRTADKGTEIFYMLLNKSLTVPVQINHDIYNATCNDMKIMQKYKNIKVSLIDVKRLAGKGIQHSKMIIGDGDRAFVGSPNMDWRSLTQIKEIGAYITSCTDLVYDLNAFWLAINYLSGSNSKIPKVWPRNTWPKYNMTNQLKATVNGVPMRLYTATSPQLFNPPHRTDDLTAIKNTIKGAKRYILISVMDFVPLTDYFSSHGHKRYWPDIADALLAAAIDKRVDVKLLVSIWSHSPAELLIFARSIARLGKRFKTGSVANIHVKAFIIPAFNELQRKIPFARVSHSKYMVTESTAYIGTSNWSGDYFDSTVGLSLVAKDNCKPAKCKSKSIRKDLKNIFFVDWNSIYAHDV